MRAKLRQACTAADGYLNSPTQVFWPTFARSATREEPMSIFGSMRTAVSGMNAQANKLATVSDNIANVSTTAYKSASTAFSSLVVQSGTTSYTSGGVQTA